MGHPSPPRSRQGGERHRGTRKRPRLPNRPLDARPNHKTPQNQAPWRDCLELQDDHRTETEYRKTETRKTPYTRDPISTIQKPDNSSDRHCPGAPRGGGWAPPPLRSGRRGFLFCSWPTRSQTQSVKVWRLNSGKRRLLGRKRPFVHDAVCLQFLEGLFAILAECSQFCLRPFNRNSRRNPSLCWLGGGALWGTKIVNKNFVNKLAFPTIGRKVCRTKLPPKKS